MKAEVKFYGIITKAVIYGDSFDLRGKNKFTQKLLNIYIFIIFLGIGISNFFRFLFGLEKSKGMKIGIIEILEE